MSAAEIRKWSRRRCVEGKTSSLQRVHKWTSMSRCLLHTIQTNVNIYSNKSIAKPVGLHQVFGGSLFPPQSQMGRWAGAVSCWSLGVSGWAAWPGAGLKVLGKGTIVSYLWAEILNTCDTMGQKICPSSWGCRRWENINPPPHKPQLIICCNCFSLTLLSPSTCAEQKLILCSVHRNGRNDVFCTRTGWSPFRLKVN